jgi:RecB family endonuclease NucS
MQADVTEVDIRDALAARPELLEPGITTVGKNYHLSNSEGARGFIDVLAGDRHGMFVVIEIKRSDSTAREAIHEVFKCCELLRAQRGLRSDQVRGAIPSSTWRELLVPFVRGRGYGPRVDETPPAIARTRP